MAGRGHTCDLIFGPIFGLAVWGHSPHPAGENQHPQGKAEHSFVTHGRKLDPNLPNLRQTFDCKLLSFTVRSLGDLGVSPHHEGVRPGVDKLKNVKDVKRGEATNASTEKN
jgi:hypothetical protein